MSKNFVLPIIVSAMVLNLHSNGFVRQESMADGSFLTDSTFVVSSKPIVAIGSRIELFVDDYLIEKLSGKAELRLQHPVPQEIAIIHDEPWEGSGSGFHSIFKDGDIYRMYYETGQLSSTPFESKVKSHPGYCCYAESNDGIHWRKPKLGLHDFEGSKANNIILTRSKVGNVFTRPEIPGVFKDENPNAAPDAVYKAIIPTSITAGFLPYKSPDGIHWSLMTNDPIITGDSFDSQNVAFWDSIKGEYRAYWRSNFEGVRSIRTGTSKNFLNWGELAQLRYVDSPPEALYNSAIKPYYRAPHILIGLPFRYVNRGWSESMRALPELEHREWRGIGSERHGTALTEGLFMTSRDGILFKRWNEAFLRPGIEREGTWNYGHLSVGWSIVETKSAFEGAPNELSLYATESYWTGNSASLRRYTLRMDGFISVNAPASGGELITKPLTFTGNKLVLNFSTAAAGNIYVEIQDMEGKALPGYSLKDCGEIYGDAIEREVHWKKGSDVSSLAGKPVRLCFVLKDADLFSFQFK